MSRKPLSRKMKKISLTIFALGAIAATLLCLRSLNVQQQDTAESTAMAQAEEKAPAASEKVQATSPDRQGAANAATTNNPAGQIAVVEEDEPRAAETEEVEPNPQNSLLQRLKELPETTVLDTSVVKEDYGNELLQRRSHLLETSLKYPYVEVIEWGSFDEEGNPVETEVTAQVASHLIVEKREDVSFEEFAAELQKRGFVPGQSIDETTFIVQIPGKAALGKCEEAINELASLDQVAANAEPDYVVSIGKIPTDSRFFDLWGMHNSGQTGGKSDVDIDAPEAWEKGTGSRKVLVAVIDTGIDRGHQDLRANMWTNPREIPNNGRDDDGNGYVDDVHGWDFHNNDNNPHDDNSHGTHCAGTIGAAGNNRLGVVGVNWEVSMVGIKFLGGSGFGYNSDAIKSINYATSIKANLTSNSWGGGGHSSSMKKAIDTAGTQGIAFVAAAGNHRANNDRSPSYPASFDSANVIAVGAHEHNGRITDFSCYGKNSVDLFAPGENILSTTPNNGYKSYRGTSMACPHVAGAYALISSIEPTWGMSQIKQALIDSVDPEAGLKEKCVSGGRLNVFRSLSSEPAKKKLISVTPTNVEFGKVRLGESKIIELLITNPGTDETTITETTLSKKITRPENLIGHWTFDEGSGNVAANTGTKGNTYKATLLSGAVFSTKEKKLGTGSLHIPSNQSRAYARIGNPLKLGNGSYRGETFTISAWFKKLYPNQVWRTLCRGSSYGHHLIVGYRNDSVGVYANSNGDWRDSGEFDMPAKNFQDNWNHIVAVSNKATNRTQFYLNGLYKGDSDRATGNNIYAIGNYQSGNQRFAEYLDDFRVYDVALSAEEVKGIFNEEKADTPFRFSLQTPVKLAPGKGVKATVTFSGAEKGKHAGNLLIVSDATNNPALTVPLSVEVTAFPKLVLSEDSLHFGLNQDEIEEKPLTLSNVGDADLTYEIVVSENADGPNFSNGLRAVGRNYYGELGDGTKTQRTKPVQVEDKAIKEVAAGSYHSLVLKED